MTWPCKPPLWTAVLALLSGCAASAPLPPPPPAPQPLAAPLLSAADIRQAEQHAYWLGYAAGRRYQKQQDAQNTPDAPSPVAASIPAAATPPVTAMAAVPVATAAIPPNAPVQPMPPPVDSYSPKGPAQPVATPVN